MFVWQDSVGLCCFLFRQQIKPQHFCFPCVLGLFGCTACRLFVFLRCLGRGVCISMCVILLCFCCWVVWVCRCGLVGWLFFFLVVDATIWHPVNRVFSRGATCTHLFFIIFFVFLFRCKNVFLLCSLSGWYIYHILLRRILFWTRSQLAACVCVRAPPYAWISRSRVVEMGWCHPAPNFDLFLVWFYMLAVFLSFLFACFNIYVVHIILNLWVVWYVVSWFGLRVLTFSFSYFLTSRWRFFSGSSFVAFPSGVR